MRRTFTIITALSMVLATAPQVRPHSIEFTDSAAPRQIRWPAKTIVVALSTSLSSPGPNIKPGSNVVGALRRALSRWSTAANLTFVEVTSTATSISPGSAGDGISLITIADTAENNSIFGSGGIAGRTRIFYDKVTGAIVEADVVINPHPTYADSPMQFSTDGTPGTYDLESTFTHELGHLLGLEHSAVIAATMQARQGINGVYRSPAFTERTLSEVDRAAVQSLYGPRAGWGAIEGKLIGSTPGSDPNLPKAAHVWIESIATGRVIASEVTTSRGSYRIEEIPPGEYRVLAEFTNGSTSAVEKISLADRADNSVSNERVLRSAEISNQSVVTADTTTTVNAALLPSQNVSPILKPRFIGANSELSTTPVPVEAGKRFTIYVGGESVDQVPASGISVTSPYLIVDPNSLARQQFGTPFPVISFDITVAPNAVFGDYSLRLQSDSGEVAYLPGAITVDPGVESAFPNPTDDARFFVSQHYRDFLGREPDRGGLEYWVSKLAQCESDSECIRRRRIDISAAFFIETEFQETGSLVYRLYRAALGRRPTFSEFNGDRTLIGRRDLESGREAFASALIRREEFIRKYPATLKADQFVDNLLSLVLQNSGADLSSERTTFAALYDGSDAGRARIVGLVADNALFAKAEYSRAFVLMQYFSYLRRDPDQGGYTFWVNTLDSSLATDSKGYRGMVCSFINSSEYQARFGLLATHTHKECRP